MSEKDSSDHAVIWRIFLEEKFKNNIRDIIGNNIANSLILLHLAFIYTKSVLTILLEFGYYLPSFGSSFQLNNSFKIKT